jgi:uncharacterized protein (DUF58 family)
MSDFIARGYEQALGITHRKHEVIAIRVRDPREQELPPAGIVELEDAETGELLAVDTADETVRSAYRQLSAQQSRGWLKVLRTAGIDYMDIRTDAPYIETMLGFFRMREKRL